MPHLRPPGAFNGECQSRVEERARTWNVCIDDLVHTPGSVIAFGRRRGAPVVLKVVKHAGDEWRSGEVLSAFGGRGVVRALDHGEGAVLLERLQPGRSLANEMIPDQEATAIIANVIARMDPGPFPSTAPAIESFSRSFERFSQEGTGPIPRSLVDVAQRTYVALCQSQSTPRLFHGDLHHHNILFDSQRGWLAIDPKGVVGELAYETGAAFRNPSEHPEVFTTPATIVERARCFAQALQLDEGRILAWAFAQAVLAAIWEMEDEGELRAGYGWLALASTIRPILERDAHAHRYI